MKKIIQTDNDIGKMMKPVSVMIAKLTELFLKRLIEKVGEQVLEEETLLGIGCPMLRMRHLDFVIRNDVRYRRSDVHCVRSLKSGPIFYLFNRMDFLIPLTKDWEDRQRNQTIGNNLKGKEKKTVTEHLIKVQYSTELTTR